MSNRIAIATLIVTILTMFIAYGQWQYPKQEITPTSSFDRNFKSQKLIVTGMNVKVFIKKGSKAYQGGEIQGLNQESTIYVPKGQHIKIEANGSNIKLMIDEELIEGISVAKSGANIKVVEL